MALNTPVKANYIGWFSEPIQNAFWLALIDKEQKEVPGMEVAKCDSLLISLSKKT